MCGRFTLKTPAADLVEVFELTREPEGIVPRFNIAPSQPVATIRLDNDGQRAVNLLRWGLVPFWAKDPNIGYKMINARGETVHEKPAFRQAFLKRRCLIPVDGFYEWERTSKRKKQPFYIRRIDGAPFAFAGLWEKWKSQDGVLLESCTIITTTPNDLLSKIHDRMPVILPHDDFSKWLDADVDRPELLSELIKTHPSDGFEMFPVGTDVNNANNERPGLDHKIGLESGVDLKSTDAVKPRTLFD